MLKQTSLVFPRMATLRRGGLIFDDQYGSGVHRRGIFWLGLAVRMK